jgi:branched-chain amino acid transport system ATP-binding protein
MSDISSQVVLSVTNLSVHYGAIKALRGISFEVRAGEIVSLIGSNGAGKTTTMHAISGLVKKTEGKVIFNGEDISSTKAERIVQRGLIQVPEGRRIFTNMSVTENLQMGAYLRRDKAGIKRDMDIVFEVFPRLKERLKQNAGTLSGGEQQMLAIGRAVMSKPSLLLLDEPSMGLAPILVDEIFSVIRRLNRAGTTILLVEQNAYKALQHATRGYVLETGSIVKAGAAGDLMRDPAVKAAYLGG